MSEPGEDPTIAGLMADLGVSRNPASGTPDDDDDRDDEHAGENEAAVRERDENTEAPEEFSVDEEDGLEAPPEDEQR
jgi:hypothetical protein